MMSIIGRRCRRSNLVDEFVDAVRRLAPGQLELLPEPMIFSQPPVNLTEGRHAADLDDLAQQAALGEPRADEALDVGVIVGHDCSAFISAISSLNVGSFGAGGAGGGAGCIPNCCAMSRCRVTNEL